MLTQTTTKTRIGAQCGQIRIAATAASTSRLTNCNELKRQEHATHTHTHTQTLLQACFYVHTYIHTKYSVYSYACTGIFIVNKIATIGRIDVFISYQRVSAFLELVCHSRCMMYVRLHVCVCVCMLLLLVHPHRH